MKYDVTVVGAGPAGSTTAKFLSEKGFKVLLIDKDKFPRDKPCGGGIPIRVLDRYPYVVRDDVIEAYSYIGTAFSPTLKYKVRAERNKPLIATVLRKKFDSELVKIARESGAIFHDGINVSDVEISDDNARVIVEDGKPIDSEIIVGADGVNSIIAKKTGLCKKGTERGTCVLQEFEIDEAVLDKYFGKTRCCYTHLRFNGILGYGWVFPKKRHLNIGVGETTSSKKVKINLLDYYNKYILFLKETELVPKNLDETPIKGGSLPLHPLEKTYSTRIILVGDAGGFINPLSGEGIYYAMKSGEIAAKIIGEALEKKQTGEKFLRRYQTTWEKDFGRDLDIISKVSQRGSMKSAENVFRVASKDTVLADLMMGVITGELSAQENKWKIVRRFVVGSLKNRIKK